MTTITKSSFEEEVRLFQEGERTEEEFRKARVLMGVYEQRERGKYLMRIRIPGGRLGPHHLTAIADVADMYNRGFLHLTSRQEIQMQDLPLKYLVPAISKLRSVGLEMRGSGGNSIRNIVACPDCDLFGDAVFDVAPFVRRLSDKLLLEKESYDLPRKLTIAISACHNDCAEAAFADIGFIARWAIGFQVLAGGGMIDEPGRGIEIEPLVPREEIYLVVSAVRRVFIDNTRGWDRRRSRMKTLVGEMGEAQFKKLYHEEKEKLRESMPWSIVPSGDIGRSPHQPSPAPAVGGDFQAWRQSQASEQKRHGTFAVTVPLLMGDMTTETAGQIAVWLWANDFKELRLTPDQNILIPDVPGNLLPKFYSLLINCGLGRAEPRALADMAVCAGSGVCKHGVCRTRDAAMQVLKLANRPYWRHPALQRLSIRISGCTNQCSGTGAATLGFVGVSQSSGERPYPAYQVYWGGRAEGVYSSTADLQGTVPARWMALFVDDFLTRLEGILPRDADAERVSRTGRTILRACLAEFQQSPSYESAPLFYHDVGSDESPFSTEDSDPDDWETG